MIKDSRTLILAHNDSLYPGNFVTSGTSATSNASNFTLQNWYSQFTSSNALELFVANSSGEPVDKLRMVMGTNPKQCSITMKKANREEYTYQGWVIEPWGEEFDTISVTGVSSAFILESSGLTRVEGKKSTGYQNLMSLIILYRNNGSVYLDTTTSTLTKFIGGRGNRRVIASRRLIGMTFMGKRFYGSFDSFSFSESAERPFQFEYSFQFTVMNTPDKDKGYFIGHIGTK